MGTVPTIIVFVVLVLVTMVLGELLMRKLGVHLEYSRKTFHLLAGTVCIVMPYVADEPLPLLIVAGIFMVSLPLTIELNLFKIQTKKRGYGTAAFAAGYFVIVWMFWDRKDILTSALVILTYGDGLAAIVGHRFGKRKYRVGRAHKTLEGTLTFVIVSFAGVAPVLLFNQTAPAATVAWVALALAIVSAVVEAICIGDIDNGVIPVFSAIMLALLLDMDAGGQAWFSVGIAMGGAVAVLSYVRRWVSLQGGLVVFLILVVNFGLGSWKWLLPPLILLVSASLLSKLTKGWVNPFVANRGPRGLTQIAAKGIPSMLLAMAWAMTGWEPFYLVCLAIVATASADTFASSIGGLARKAQIYSLPTLALVPKGMSGGVTLLGTAAGALGAAVSAAFIFPFVATDAWVQFGIVAACGLAGAFVDTLLGSTVQALYRCKACGSKTEARVHCEHKTRLSRGVAWMNNEMVNLTSGLAGGAFASALIYWGIL